MTGKLWLSQSNRRDLSDGYAVIGLGRFGLAVCEELVRWGADLDARGPNGLTALMQAARYGHVEVTRALLAGGANRTLQASDNFLSGMTACEIAEGWRPPSQSRDKDLNRYKTEVAALLRE